MSLRRASVAGAVSSSAGGDKYKRQVAYLQNMNSAYIDLGFTGEATSYEEYKDLTYRVRFNNVERRSGWVFGAFSGSSGSFIGSAGIGISAYRPGVPIDIKCSCSGDAFNVQSETLPFGVFHDVELVRIDGAPKVYIDGKATGKISEYSGSGIAGLPRDTLLLFSARATMYDESTIASFPNQISNFSFKWPSRGIDLDMIPVIDMDDVPCMHDLVHKKNYYNVGPEGSYFTFEEL